MSVVRNMQVPSGLMITTHRAKRAKVKQAASKTIRKSARELGRHE